MGKMVNRIPELLRQYAKEKGLGVEKLGNELNVSQSYISRLLRDQTPDSFRFDFTERVCHLLDLTPNDLLWEEDEET